MKRYVVVATFGGSKRMRVVVQAQNQAEAVTCAVNDTRSRDLWDASVIQVAEMLDVSDRNPFLDAT